MIFRHDLANPRGVNAVQARPTVAAHGLILRSTTVSGVQRRTTLALAKRWHRTPGDRGAHQASPWRKCFAESAPILCASEAPKSVRPSMHHDIMVTEPNLSRKHSSDFL